MAAVKAVVAKVEVEDMEVVREAKLLNRDHLPKVTTLPMLIVSGDVPTITGSPHSGEPCLARVSKNMLSMGPSKSRMSMLKCYVPHQHVSIP
ncbi:hypothetical protein KDW_03290 [Dictyobacter vulcani]|uniref:Uncharacterized protein n=1 Tax=Dictyobacter vulcani TaxID=2607529 RepID=A0A5J4KI71_9CHLR|nr:hypothetical protein KDW_03290 [Dictyobacter vulcani]